jgi:serine protease Do
VVEDPGEVGAPGSLDELRELERRVEETSRRVMPTVVCLQVGGGSGSGVIVSPDGWVLTAGHVSGQAEQAVTVVFHDGHRGRAVTMGANNHVDSGLARLIGDAPPGGWPYAEMGESTKLKMGQWLIAMGHPGGYHAGRPPVVRLGRLVAVDRDEDGEPNTLTTDNTLVGGDSGGPMFDLDGRVVGIHSRIAPNVTLNMDVPVDVWVRDWERLSVGEVWPEGRRQFVQRRAPYFGAELENAGTKEGDGVRVRAVAAGGPAAMGGLKVDDVIVGINGEDVGRTEELMRKIYVSRPGVVVTLEVRRGAGEVVEVKVKLGEPKEPSTKPKRRRR